MLIAAQRSAPFERREVVAPHILCADSALQVILAGMKKLATPRVEKVCTLNAKGTAGRRRPKRSRERQAQKRHGRFAKDESKYRRKNQAN